MIPLFEYVSERLTNTENYIAKSTGWLSGLAAMIYFKFEMAEINLLFTWVGLINTLLVFATSAITTIVVLIATDLYKYAKPKTVIFIKAKYLIIKTKCYGNKKNIETDKEERA